MTIDISKKIGTEKQYQYLSELDYKPSNLPNVSVHYGEIRAICIEKKSSAFISEGSIQSFSKQPKQKIVQYDIIIEQPIELRNETTRKVYMRLDECMLLDEKVGDLILHYKPMIESDLILDKWKRIMYINSIVNNKREKILWQY